MPLIENVLARFGYTKAQGERPAHLGAIAQAAMPYVDRRDTWHRQALAYTQSSWVYKAVSTMARSAALVALGVYEVTGDGQREAIDNHPLELLLRKPNPFQSRFEFMEATYTALGINGNAFWYNRPTLARTPGELWPLRPDRMTIVPSATEYVAGYVYEVDGRPIPFERGEIVHFHYYHPLQDYEGLSQIQPLAYSIDSDTAAQAWNKDFFDNHAAPDTVMWTEQSISESDFKALVASWKQEHQGKGKAHKTAFLQKGLKPERLNSSQKDMEFIALRKLAREETWQVFSMPMGMWTENATEANANVALQTYYNFGLWPLLCLVADKITSDILPAYGENQVAEYEDIRITDRKLEIEEIRVALQTHTVNEVRTEYYDLEPLKQGGDVVLSGVMQTIDASEPEPARPPPAPLTGAPVPPMGPPPPPVVNAQAEMARTTAEIAGKAELVKWEAWALKRMRAGMWPPDRAFKARALEADLAQDIVGKLELVKTEQEVRGVFEDAGVAAAPTEAEFTDSEREYAATWIAKAKQLRASGKHAGFAD